MSDFGRMPNFDYHGFDWPGGPDYEPPASPRCSLCGGFLPWTPDEQEPWEDTIECDGAARGRVVEHEGEILEILGPGTYTEWWSDCGSVGGEHQPHREVVAAGVTFRTKCRKCGTVNTDNGL